MEGLSSEDLDIFKSLLERQLEELLLRAEETVHLLSRDAENNNADLLDRAAVDSGRESSLRFRERESRLIGKIKIALSKIDEGIFGICESCGENIPLPRLKARPVACHCIRCKTQMESWEKVMGM